MVLANGSQDTLLPAWLLVLPAMSITASTAGVGTMRWKGLIAVNWLNPVWKWRWMGHICVYIYTVYTYYIYISYYVCICQYTKLYNNIYVYICCIYIVYIHISWVLFMNWNFGALAPKCDDGNISITVTTMGPHGSRHGMKWKF